MAEKEARCNGKKKVKGIDLRSGQIRKHINNIAVNYKFGIKWDPRKNKFCGRMSRKHRADRGGSRNHLVQGPIISEPSLLIQYNNE